MENNERQKPGPRPTGRARISRGISFLPEHYKWLEQFPNRSEVVEIALNILILMDETSVLNPEIKSHFQNLKNEW